MDIPDKVDKTDKVDIPDKVDRIDKVDIPDMVDRTVSSLEYFHGRRIWQ